jgi:hypothetical protein
MQWDRPGRPLGLLGETRLWVLEEGMMCLVAEMMRAGGWGWSWWRGLGLGDWAMGLG